MERLIQLNDNIIINTEDVHTGGVPDSDDEKNIRRILGLPITKPIIYYKNKSDQNSLVSISSFKIIEAFDISSVWFTIELQLADGSKIRIHSDFLKDMQKTSFISDMKQTSLI